MSHPPFSKLEANVHELAECGFGPFLVRSSFIQSGRLCPHLRRQWAQLRDGFAVAQDDDLLTALGQVDEPREGIFPVGDADPHIEKLLKMARI
jgi:hypothetical protein